ncbi:neuromedin U [Turdus rufiventris]|nr:neuromedin U [Turdus rufiventris]
MGQRYQQQQQRPAASPERSKAGHGRALPPILLIIILLLASSVSAGQGAPMPSQALVSDEDLQLLKEIDDACSAYLSTDSQPQGLDEKDNTKRFLFHYSKTHDSGNSDITVSGIAPSYEKNFKDLE